jgi:hypothetical protein
MPAIGRTSDMLSASTSSMAETFDITVFFIFLYFIPIPSRVQVICRSKGIFYMGKFIIERASEILNSV